MEWIVDPTAWLGLLTLIVLELVLGIDNLVFIAILADKLPPHQRDRARIIMNGKFHGVMAATGPTGSLMTTTEAFLSWVGMVSP